MQPDVLIVGQGLAGTLLAWECERAGISFTVADAARGDAASLVGAGIVNPITGRRLVKSWRVEEWLPLARTTYRAIEAALGVRIWHELRVWRAFADARERAAFAEKFPRGELSPFASADSDNALAADASGFWIEGAARVDCAALIAAVRERWRAQNRWRESACDPVAEAAAGRHALVVDCTGLAATRRPEFAFVPWEFSKGELLEIAVAGLAPDVVLNRRHWVLPVGSDAAWVGATHEPGQTAPVISATAAARATLETSARELLGDRAFRVFGQRAGVRVNLPDKHPVAGRHSTHSRLGVVNGLGAKGALWAPMLARAWALHFTRAVPFDPEIALARFAG